ncbi:MAG: TlpA disulfide reductase family protein [Bryobacteraceae bacterium]
MRHIGIRSLAMVILAAATLTIACSSSTEVEAAPRLKPEKDRKLAPDFTLKDSNGATVRLSDYRGKVVLLDFWATWCTPCQVEIPWFMEFEQSLKGKGFAVVGVSMDEDGWDVVKPYIQRRRINYRILLGDDHTGQLYGGVESLPMTFLLDRQGRVAAVHIGLANDKDGFLHEITELLGARRAGTGTADGGVTALAGAK